MRLKNRRYRIIDFCGGGVHTQTNLQFINMRLQTVKSEVGRLLASVYKSNHKSQAGSDQATFILGADTFLHVIVLYCVMKLHEI
jgi:hypothetical protein